MAANPGKIKSGMGGSRNGKSRRMKTELLKLYSKKKRREMGKKECQQID